LEKVVHRLPSILCEPEGSTIKEKTSIGHVSPHPEKPKLSELVRTPAKYSWVDGFMEKGKHFRKVSPLNCEYPGWDVVEEDSELGLYSADC
jgi:hypothetical protein